MHIVMKAALLGATTAFVAAHAVEFTQREDDASIEVLADGHHFFTYESPFIVGRPILRPYLKNVMAPNGQQVTRLYPPDPEINKDNDDHPNFHPGIWMAFGDVNGFDFWRNKSPMMPGGDPKFPHAHKWSGDHFDAMHILAQTDQIKQIVGLMNTAYDVYDTGLGYLITMDTHLRVPEGDMVFGDQEEMGLGVRMDTRLTVKFGSGHIVNSEGGENEAGTWGKQADWCAYYGVENGTRIGIVLMAHPGNFRQSWFHTRDYGLMVANPFGMKAMTAPDDPAVKHDSTVVKKGESLRLRYGLLVFSNPEEEPFDGASAYKEYLARVADGGE